MDQEYMQEEWKTFIASGEILPSVREEIGESWKRSRALGIDSDHTKGRTVPADEFETIKKYNRDLLFYSKPIMENLYRIIQEHNSIIYITDADAVILDLIGDPEDMVVIKEGYNVSAGVLWSEETVGTNAISLALRYKKTYRTEGCEHYCREHHFFSCSVVPIHDAMGEVIGTLVNTCLNAKASSHTLGMVQAAAQLIENEVARARQIQFMKVGMSSISEAVIITDSAGDISFLNAKGCTYLGCSERKLLRRPISSVIPDVRFPEVTESRYNVNFHIFDGSEEIPCVGNFIYLEYNGEQIGLAAVFRKERSINTYINNLVGNTAKYHFSDIITRNPAMLRVIEDAKRISGIDCTVLINGESGTGKELVAQAIHNQSKRREGPFIAVNCAALPRDLVESELFGYVAGSFTSAKKGGMLGKFELADGGTLFLDEIGELSMDIQPKLLRALDSHKISKIGSKKDKYVDVRVITATNKTLESEIAEGDFRLDLFYRINTVNFIIPSLNERREDIPLLCLHFLEQLNAEFDMKVSGFEPEFISALQAYEFKGNIRELQNLISRAFFLCSDDTIGVDLLPAGITRRAAATAARPDSVPMTVGTKETIEKEMIIRALQQAGNNVTEAAKTLNIGKATIYRKIKKYGISYR